MTQRKKRNLLVAVCCVLSVALFFAIGLTLTKNSSALAEESTYSVTEQNGLGLGINAVKAKKVNDFVTGYSILDPEKIPQIPTSRITLNSSESFNHSTSNVKELILEYNTSFNINGKLTTLLGSMQADLENVVSITYNNFSYKYYNILEHNLLQYNQYFNNYSNPATYTNYYTDSYLADLESLTKSKNFYSFFEKYGTHLVGSANFGGRLIASYIFASNNFILNNEVSSKVGLDVEFDDLKSLSKVEIATEINNYYRTNYSSSDLQTGFYVKAIGGNAFSSGIISNFDSGYSNWVNSFNSTTDKSVLINYTNNGLVPLWNILPAPYNTSLANDMEDAFIEYYNDFEDDIIEEFKSSNTKDFAGGTGCKEDPFLIKNETQLKNIDRVSMNADYKLVNDINLNTSEWVSLGGFYRENDFNGTLDGNGKKISNLRRTADITEKAIDGKNAGFFFGLFGAIGPDGEIKNLTMNNVYIHMDGPEVDNSKARIFVGAIAGMIKGNIEGVTINGVCSYDVCTNGIVYTGGLGGAAYKATLKNCKNNSSVTSGRYTGVAGGIVAHSTGATFDTCSNTGSITAKCTNWGGIASAAGISGEIYYKTGDVSLYTTIIKCSNSGSISAMGYGGNFPFPQKNTGDITAKQTTNIYD